jgi:hypothetical protein
MANPIEKYRPSLTAQQIAYLTDLVANDNREATAKLQAQTLSYFKLFAFKSQLGIVSAAFSSSPRQTLEERLGSEAEDKSAKREAAFAIYTANPKLCTPEQIKLAKTHMWELGLIGDDEL